MDASHDPTNPTPVDAPDEGAHNDGLMGSNKHESKAQGRKRTKTGCLTCRRRRIKCGEERPTCQNCKKSKRQCEGYIQRVVFKDPLNSYRPSFPGPSHLQYSGIHPYLPVKNATESSRHPQSTTSPVHIAPKATPAWLSTSSTKSQTPAPASEFGTRNPPPSGVILSLQNSSSRLVTQHDCDIIEHCDGFADGDAQSRLARSTNCSISQACGYPRIDSENDMNLQAKNLILQLKPSMLKANETDQPASQTLRSQNQSSQYIEAKADTLIRSYPGARPQRWPMDLETRASQTAHVDHLREHEESVVWDLTEVSRDMPRSSKALRFTQEFLVGNENDSLHDVSDEKACLDKCNSYAFSPGNIEDHHLTASDLGAVIAFQAEQEIQNLPLRSFTSFIDRPDMLATYVPSAQSSPLHDRMTARIFVHFVNVTGPSISMFERHPANPSLIFQGEPVPKSQQHIWTYIFPTLALQDPALLHSMLAVASLHIAKLQNGPVTASLKHYAFGLRRVAKSVSLPQRRQRPATLAAAMLLAFYECWSADHQKWSNHLLGARQLVREIDFAAMTQRIKIVKLQRRGQAQSPPHRASQVPDVFEFGSSYSASEDVDESIISVLMGRKLRYNQYESVVDDHSQEFAAGSIFTEKDLETYEILRDLFWWYCKQDVYQSILGGGRLFMEYSLWSHCPPRSPMGRLNATYGTYDHLILLMGRLADFAARDLRRKRLAIQMNGGWRPSQGMQMGNQSDGSSYSQIPRLPQQTSLRGQMPSFSGMVPVTGEAQLPMGFSAARDESPRSANIKDEADFELQGVEAELEWKEIRSAFHLLEGCFGEDFQPLGPEFSAPVDTPFGPAKQYRTYGIAGVWMNYYMGLIACYRSHPSMPPAAMVAAGVAAAQTAFFATELGRIAAGIEPDCSFAAHVSPGVGAALIESATCLFVAGVQYQNAAQRVWTVQRLQDIARLTGWQTAHAIAAGCEKTWVKTAELGRGPPYTRIEVTQKIPDLSSSSRRIDRAFYGRNNDERRMIIQRPDSVHYALGLLGVQEDFENLNLDDEDGKRQGQMGKGSYR